MRPSVPSPAIVTDRDPRRDPELARLIARAPDLRFVVVEDEDGVGPGARAVADALLTGRAVRLRAHDPRGPAAAAVEAGRDGAALTVGTLVDRADAWLANVVTAFPVLAALPGAEAFEGAWCGRPALVAGAGPSLDALEEGALQRLGGASVVVASGSALASLEGHGVRADVAVVIEGADCSAQLTGPVRLRDTLLALAQHGHPAHLSVPCAGRVRLDMAENAWFAGLAGSRVIVPSAGNVGATALWLALHAGCSPIVLAGLDLALGPGATHHARDAASGAFGDAGGRETSVDAAGGGRVGSNALLGAYREGIERIIQDAPGRAILNLVGPGKARIAGTREVTVRDAIRAVRRAHEPRRASPAPPGPPRAPVPGDLVSRTRAVAGRVESFERLVSDALASGADADAIRACVASACRSRPGTLEAVLFHGHALDPRVDPRESLPERLERSRRVRVALVERAASLVPA